MKHKLPVLLTIVVVVASVVGDLIFVPEPGDIEFGWLYLPGFFLLLGLIGCVLLIIIGKLIGHYLLHREEDYYD